MERLAGLSKFYHPELWKFFFNTWMKHALVSFELRKLHQSLNQNKDVWIQRSLQMLWDFDDILGAYRHKSRCWGTQGHIAQKMKFSIKDFFSKCDQICSSWRFHVFTFTEKIFNGKLHFVQCQMSKDSSLERLTCLD